MKERLITTLTWPQSERDSATEVRESFNRFYEYQNLLSDVQSDLDCLLIEPRSPCDWATIAALKIKKGRLLAAILQQRARLRDLGQSV
jgi:hypothetical protein